MTFITTIQFLENQQIAYGGHMAAAMALMESPAIIMAVLLANRLRQQAGQTEGGHTPTPLGKILHESFTDGAQLLLLGAMLIGLLTGEAGKAAMAPFSVDLFKGMLAFFLLDMGLMTARNLGGLKGKSPWLLAYAILARWRTRRWRWPGQPGWRQRGQCRAADGAGRQRLVYRRAGSAAKPSRKPIPRCTLACRWG